MKPEKVVFLDDELREAFESLKEVKKAWKEIESGDFVRFKNKEDFFKGLDKW
jgi:hypothetical protein